MPLLAFRTERNGAGSELKLGGGSIAFVNGLRAHAAVGANAGLI